MDNGSFYLNTNILSAPNKRPMLRAAGVLLGALEKFGITLRDQLYLEAKVLFNDSSPCSSFEQPAASAMPVITHRRRQVEELTT